MKPALIAWLTLLTALLLSACAPAASRVIDPLAAWRQADGSLLWQQEYRFAPPPAPWQLIDLNEDDYSIAFMKLCAQDYPCQSTFAYAEDPFGYSLDFEERQQEFFKRFLWASRVNFEAPKTRRVTVLGQEGLEAVTLGTEPVLGHKVRARVVFARRGERVVGFYFTQWRAKEVAFDQADETDFDAFVASFGFARPSFYQNLGTQ